MENLKIYYRDYIQGCFYWSDNCYFSKVALHKLLCAHQACGGLSGERSLGAGLHTQGGGGAALNPNCLGILVA